MVYGWQIINYLFNHCSCTAASAVNDIKMGELGLTLMWHLNKNRRRDACLQLDIIQHNWNIQDIQEHMKIAALAYWS